MATHYFICDKCNITVTDTTIMGDHKCPECNNEMWLDAKIAIQGNYNKPVHSDAMAINPCQRAEHERLFPNIRLDGDCRPILENFTDHENYIKKRGYVKERQKIKPKGKKLQQLPTPDV